MNRHHRIRADRAALVAVLTIAIDQLTKWLAFSSTQAGSEAHVIPGLTISQTRNEGIAFGYFAGRPYLVLGLMAAALAVLLWFYVGHRSRPVLWLATGLLLGGALGNAIDRVALGYVRDFFNLPGWPSFNLADTAITIGVAMLVLAAEHGSDEDSVLPDKPSGSSASGGRETNDQRD